MNSYKKLPLALLPLLFCMLSLSSEKESLSEGLKSVRTRCNSEKIQKMKILTEIRGTDSVFQTLDIQLKVSSNFSYSCIRGNFKKPLISCQVIDCDSKTIATLIYEKKKTSSSGTNGGLVKIYQNEKD